MKTSWQVLAALISTLAIVSAAAVPAKAKNPGGSGGSRGGPLASRPSGNFRAPAMSSQFVRPASNSQVFSKSLPGSASKWTRPSFGAGSMATQLGAGARGLPAIKSNNLLPGVLTRADNPLTNGPKLPGSGKLPKDWKPVPGPFKPIDPGIGNGTGGSGGGSTSPGGSTTPGSGGSGGGTGGGSTGTGGNDNNGNGNGNVGNGNSGDGNGIGNVVGNKIVNVSVGGFGGGGYGGGYSGGYSDYSAGGVAAVASDAAIAPVASTSVAASVVTVVNPATSTQKLNFAVSGEWYALDTGSSQSFPAGAVIEFDRGGTFGTARYTLEQGAYTFALTEKGWELYQGTVVTSGATPASTFASR